MIESEYILSAGLEFFYALISIILMVGCLFDPDRKRKTNRLMIIILAIHAVMNAVDACIWIWCNTPSLLNLMKAFSFLSYALGCIIITLFSYILIAYINEYTATPKWIERFILAISSIMILLWCISLFNDMYYYWDAAGNCYIGEWFWCFFSISFLFLFIAKY